MSSSHEARSRLARRAGVAVALVAMLVAGTLLTLHLVSGSGQAASREPDYRGLSKTPSAAEVGSTPGQVQRAESYFIMRMSRAVPRAVPSATSLDASGTHLVVTYGVTSGGLLTPSEEYAAMRAVATSFPDGLVPLPVDFVFTQDPYITNV